MDTKQYKRRRWLFWIIFIPLLIASIWIWSDIFKSCEYQKDMERQTKTIKIPQDQV